MKYIITETQLHYLRRLSILDDLIRHSLQMFDWERPYIDVDYVIDHVSNDVSEQYFFRYFEDEEVTGDMYNELSDFLKSYLNKEWKHKIERLIKLSKQQ